MVTFMQQGQFVLRVNGLTDSRTDARKALLPVVLERNKVRENSTKEKVEKTSRKDKISDRNNVINCVHELELLLLPTLGEVLEAKRTRVVLGCSKPKTGQRERKKTEARE